MDLNDAFAAFWTSVEDAVDGRRAGTVEDNEAYTEVFLALGNLRGIMDTCRKISYDPEEGWRAE